MASDEHNRNGSGSASGCPVRRFPLRTPENHKPPIARYSAAIPENKEIAVLFLGIQSQRPENIREALKDIPVGAGDAAPVYADHARFIDPQGYRNHITALYWTDAVSFDAWSGSERVLRWREQASARAGISWEPVVLRGERMETISFDEFRRGFSGCPRMPMTPTIHSGYWGAARDRIPAAAYDLFEPVHAPVADAAGAHIRIRPPENMAVIRSGVSWRDCVGEQLADYQHHIRPKLDAGMEYLRTHPEETGCISLRQVTAVDAMEEEQPEGYSLGFFSSLASLEKWAKDHPSHLAIYTRAMAARRKYQDKLQLRTYNEIFVIGKDNPPFEYFGCHPNTGLMASMKLAGEANSEPLASAC